MRFRASIVNINTFTKFTASLATLGHIAWVRLDDKDVRFTVIPEQGTQVWAVLTIDSILENYSIQSAAPNNTINLEVPLAPLQRALKSAQNAIAANIRLTKKDNIPLLSLTITTSTINSGPPSASAFNARGGAGEDGTDGFDASSEFREESVEAFSSRAQDRETTVTQDIPIRVL
ncbi:checkpoint protein Hus1/Mec3, partial [Neohortaea acidophila]